MRGSSGGACMVAPRGGMHGCSRGACMVALGGGGGVCGCSWGACMVFARGVCMVFPGGHVWFSWGGACVGYNKIRLMSRRYTSYWNAFLLFICLPNSINAISKYFTCSSSDGEMGSRFYL